MTRTFGKSPNRVVIEDIPLICCSKCGEAYFTAETMHEIERVRAHRKSFGTAQVVTVAQLPITTDEIYRRLAELKSGKVKGIPGAEALARIKAKYTK